MMNDQHITPFPNTNKEENNNTKYTTMIAELIKKQTSNVPKEIPRAIKDLGHQIETTIMPNIIKYEPLSRPFQIQAERLGIQVYFTKLGIRIQIPEETWEKYGQQQMKEIEVSNFQEIAWASIEQYPNGFTYLIHMTYADQENPLLFPECSDAPGPMIIQMLKQVFITAAYQTKFYKLLYLWGQYDMSLNRPYYKPNQIPISSLMSTEEKPKYHPCGLHFPEPKIYISNTCPFPNYKCPFIKNLNENNLRKEDQEYKSLPSLIQKMNLGSQLRTNIRTQNPKMYRSRFDMIYGNKELGPVQQRETTLTPKERTLEEEGDSDNATCGSKDSQWDEMLIDLDQEL